MAKVNTKKVVKRRREKKNIEKGAVHIQATFNNTIVTVSDAFGNTISWSLPLIFATHSHFSKSTRAHNYYDV